jgi:NAD(P)-dependent dehydrogenase (short-subunit alcohol dehydrogenase family)
VRPSLINEAFVLYLMMTSHENTVRGFETNFFGAMKVTRAILPFMRSQRFGTIMFMGSIAGWYSAAAGGLYASSKCALEGE